MPPKQEKKPGASAVEKDVKKLSKAEKEAAKKAAKTSKQATKSAKSASKKARKDGAISDDEDDIELIMKELAAKDAKRTAVVTESCSQPSPRVNFSVNSINGGELVLFGGEYYDGASNTCFNDLFRFDPKGRKNATALSSSRENVSNAAAVSGGGGGGGGGSGVGGESSSSDPLMSSLGSWKTVSSPNTPSPRCSHQSVLLNSGATLLIFGGEFGTANQFHHFNDTWKLDLASSKWTKLDLKKAPSARSGHRMAAWRNFAVLFGGFHQTLTSDRWFGDLWLFDNRTDLWQEVVFPSTHSLPAPRSGSQFVMLPNKDCAVLYGGYSEVRSTGAEGILVPSKGGKGGGGKGGGGGGGGSGDSNLLFRKSKSVVHTDMWLLRLSPLLLSTPSAPTWERIRAVGIPPSPRVGFTMSTWRDKLILFGGVLDKEGGATDEGEEVGPVKPTTGGDVVAKKGAHSAKKGSDEIVRSAFYNDMYSFDLGRKRWYKLDLKKKKLSTRGEEKVKTRRRQGEGEEGEDNEEEEEEDNEEEEEEDDDDDDIDHQKGPTNGGGKPSLVEDLALYYYQDGKLVRMEDDEEEGEGGDVIAGAADGVSSDVAGAVDGVSSDVAGAVDGVSSDVAGAVDGEIGRAPV